MRRRQSNCTFIAFYPPPLHCGTDDEQVEVELPTSCFLVARKRLWLDRMAVGPSLPIFGMIFSYNWSRPNAGGVSSLFLLLISIYYVYIQYFSTPLIAYNPLYRSVGWLVGWSVVWSVGRSVGLFASLAVLVSSSPLKCLVSLFHHCPCSQKIELHSKK